jgi:hypothetical protein
LAQISSFQAVTDVCYPRPGMLVKQRFDRSAPQGAVCHLVRDERFLPYI